jgi:hypothetical protein
LLHSFSDDAVRYSDEQTHENDWENVVASSPEACAPRFQKRGEPLVGGANTNWVLPLKSSECRRLNAIYWWNGESEDVKLLKDLADVVGANGERKAEGLLPLDESASGLRVLILFDSEKEGAPVAVMIPRP